MELNTIRRVDDYAAQSEALLPDNATSVSHDDDDCQSDHDHHDNDSASSSESRSDKKKRTSEGKNPVKKFKGAFNYSTKFDSKWIGKNPDCKGKDTDGDRNDYL